MKNAMAMALLCGCAGFVIGFADGIGIIVHSVGKQHGIA